MQLFNFFNTARPARRQAEEAATRTQVESLEKTINILREQLEKEMTRHEEERNSLHGQISALNGKISELNSKVETLKQENARLLLMLGSNKN